MKTLLIALLALFSQSMAVAGAVEDNQSRNERYFAESAELETMRYIVCVAQRYSEGKSHIPCNSYAEWPLVSLGINRNAAAEQALVNLLALKLDGGFAETRDCIMQIRGKPLLTQLQKMDIVRTRNYCAELLKKAVESDVEDYSKVKPENVCNTEDTIRALRDRYVGYIEAGKKCEPWNID